MSCMMELYDDDDVYLRLKHGKKFHYFVYIYVKHINPASKAEIMNTTIQSIYAATYLASG
jgi:hypothetical protein